MQPTVSLSFQMAQELGLVSASSFSIVPETLNFATDQIGSVVSGHLQDPVVVDRLGEERVTTLRGLVGGGQIPEESVLQAHISALATVRAEIRASRAVDVPQVRMARIFVPNRGEAASRLIAAARELSAERGEKIEVVVMYTDVDADAPFVLDADHAIRIPPEKIRKEPVINQKGEVEIDPENNKPKERDIIIYNDLEHIREMIQQQIRELQAKGLNAANLGVWPGWGFQSENAELSRLVSNLGGSFMGASAAAIEKVGDKIGFKQLVDPNNTTWSGGEITTPEEIDALADKVGYPLVIKARAGGGGNGIKFVADGQQAREKLPIAREEARIAFKNPAVYAEKAIVNAPGRTVRHVELQVLVDHHGNIVVVGDRDCSIQRANQKVVEEAPATLSRREREIIYPQAIDVIRKSGYRGGAATIEGLFIAETGEFQPMELNARLQVEHTITEVTTGIDLVKEMIRIAEGKPLSFTRTPAPKGHAIEIRICAEDPERVMADGKFAPTGGVLRVFRPPTGPGIRVDTGVRQGSKITVGFDPMIAKLIVWGDSREEAIARAKRALSEFAIDGVVTNRGLALEILGHPDFFQNQHSTKWLEQYMMRRKAWEVRPNSQQALMISGVLAKLAQMEAYRSRLLGYMSNGRPPALPPNKESRFRFSMFGHDYGVEVRARDSGSYLVTVDGNPFEVSVNVNVKRDESGESWEGDFRIGNEKFQILGSQKRGDFSISVNGIPFQVSRPAMGEIEASSNFLVKEIRVQPKSKVRVGEVLMVVEAMKIQTDVVADISGEVSEIKVEKGKQVNEGTVLVTIRPPEDQKPPAPEAPRLNFAGFRQSVLAPLMAPEAPKRERDKFEKSLLDSVSPDDLRRDFRDLTGSVRKALLGYDLLDLFYQSVPKGFQRVRALTPLSNRVLSLIDRAIPAEKDKETKKYLPPIVDPGLATDEILDSLDAFVDIETLFQKSAYRSSTADRSLVDQFYDYLKNRQMGPNLEEPLKAALRHYGVTSLDASGSLDAALAHIVLAHENLEMRKEIVQRLLKTVKSWDERGALVRSSLKVSTVLEKFGRLDREHLKLIHAAEGLLFTIYEAQYGQVSREGASQHVRRAMQDVLNHPRGSDERSQTMARLVSLPDSTIVPLFQMIGSQNEEEVAAASEALFQRSYGQRHEAVSHDACWANGPYSWGLFRDGETNLLRASLGTRVRYQGDPDKLRSSIRDVMRVFERRFGAEGKPPADNTVEIFIPEVDESLRNPDALASLLESAIGYIPPQLDIKRITFTVALPNENPLHLTFRKDTTNPGLYKEDPLFRWIHPFQASQIELWRLRKHFNPEKIQVPWEGTHLLLATEKGGGDQRLFAYSIVTHLSSPRMDDQGRITGYPEVDLAFGQAVHSIRQGIESDKGKKSSNHRISMVIRPEITATEEEIKRVVARLAHKSRGLGIWQTSIRFHKIRFSENDPFEDRILVVQNPGGSGIVSKWTRALGKPEGYIRPMSATDRKARAEASKRRVYPYEFVNRLIADRGYGEGRFQEFDIENARVEHRPDGTEAVRYDLKTDLNRPAGKNTSGIVFGLVTRRTAGHPEGATVMQIMNDASNKVCPLTEAECARIIAAINYAEENGFEIDWKTTSSGAGISMEKGTENLDWTSRVMKRIGEFCDGGGVINILADDVNVGAQAYWIANAVMLPRRKGILVMTPEASTVLTGNNGQKIAGSVGAEDNVGLGGAERITGPNQETHFLVKDINEGMELIWARRDLMHHKPGDFLPPLQSTTDPFDRNIGDYVVMVDAPKKETNGGGVNPEEGKPEDEAQAPAKVPTYPVRAIMSDREKKTPFPVGVLMDALRNADAPQIPPRWQLGDVDGADLVKVMETVIGDVPAMLIGVEARPLQRKGDRPAGYPEFWTGSTLFPGGSKKMAHALNAASGILPAVVIANLSGFDGSPESLFKCQLEWGTEIEEAVRKFQGPIVFLVTTRYHGGAYVVFSSVLNPGLHIGAWEGAFASVIGEDPAAQLVFPKDINDETERRIKENQISPELRKDLAEAVASENEEKIAEVKGRVRAIVETEYKERYASIHTVERARDVGSVHEIVDPERTRPWVIHRLHEGLRDYQGRALQVADGMVRSLQEYFGQKGDMEIALWEGIVRAAQLGPHLPALRSGTMKPARELPFVDAIDPMSQRRSATPLVSVRGDMARAEGLGEGLKELTLKEMPGVVGSRVLSYARVGTTMDVLRQLMDAEFDPGLVVMADRQDKGRGRDGRVWDSPAGSNIYMSAWVDPRIGERDIPYFSYAVACAVAQTVREMTDANVQVKWPNDIYVDGRKISGILIEKVQSKGFVVGIGLNVNAESRHFSPEVAKIATSVQMITSRKWDLEVALAKLLANLNASVERLERREWGAIRDEVNESLYQRDKRVRFDYEGKREEGTVLSIAQDGSLIIRLDSGDQRRLFDGDVEVIPNAAE